VWLDTNKNGVQDTGEAGVSGVTVKLLDSNGNVVATATTDANGNYLFKDLVPGNYSVQVVARRLAPASPARTWAATTPPTAM
jgi:protocatechuate 3,4-dioxygenase beta subunit